MQDHIKIKEEEIDIFDLNDINYEHKPESDFNFPDKELLGGEDVNKLHSIIDINESNSHKENCINESLVPIDLPTNKSVQNFGKSLDKAIAEIKKGGSLVTVAYHYGIPEDILYQKLVSRSLPQEMDILSQYEENNLIKWIIKSNSQNSLVFKQQLLEKVGKMKKVLKITPIFHKSKFGRMWYEYFLRKYPEIYENDGLVMPSEDNVSTKDSNYIAGNNKSPIKSAQLKKEETKNKTKNLSELLVYFKIKNAVVVLEDFRKQKNSAVKEIEKETYQAKLQQNERTPKIENHSVKIEEDVIEFDWLRSDDESVAESDVSWKIGKAVSYLPSPKSKKRLRMKKTLKEIKPICEQCNMQFCNNAKLQRHVLIKHVPKEFYKIVCYKCLKRFPSKYHFKVHLKISHSSQYYPCPECNKLFKHKTSVRNHMKAQHSNSSSQYYSCPTCKKIFKHKENLSIHINNKHTDSSEPLFICDICKKSFRYKNSLVYHIRYGHLKEKGKYSCDICKKNFFKQSHMVRHRMRHSKIKQFSCSHCLKTFSRKYLLRDHITDCFKKQQTQQNDARSKKLEKDS